MGCLRREGRGSLVIYRWLFLRIVHHNDPAHNDHVKSETIDSALTDFECVREGFSEETEIALVPYNTASFRVEELSVMFDSVLSMARKEWNIYFWGLFACY